MLLASGRLAAALMALIAIRAVTTYLSPVQYGELALLLTVQMFCGLFLINPVGQHINLHTHAWWDQGSLVARLKAYQKYIIAVSLAGSLVVLGINKQMTGDHLFWATASMFAMIVAASWNATLIPMLNMLGFRGASVLWGVMTAAVSLVSSILLVSLFHTATSWFAGQAIGMAIGALGARYTFRMHAARCYVSPDRLPLIDKRTIVAYCLPLALATGLMWSQLSGYRFLVEWYWGLAQLGFLVVGMQVAGQIWALIETLASQFLYPLFYRRVTAHQDDGELQAAFSDLLNTLLPVYLVTTGFLVSCASYLLKLLVAPQFHGVTYFVMVGAGIEMCRVLANLLSNAAHVRRKTNSLILPYAVGAFITIASIFLAGSQHMDITWVGGSLLLGSVFMMLFMAITMYRQVKFSLNLTRLFWAFSAMLALFAVSNWLPQPQGIVKNIALISLLGLIATVVATALLWKNQALYRLMTVQLRNN